MHSKMFLVLFLFPIIVVMAMAFSSCSSIQLGVTSNVPSSNPDIAGEPR